MNRKVCVVGATGGIGLAISRRMAAEADLICMDLDSPALQNLASQPGTSAIGIDVRDEKRVKQAFAQAKQLASRIDVLVLCFGIVDNTRFEALTSERWAEILAVNLTGCFWAVREALDWISNGGKIVFLGSLAGRTGGILTGPAYAASKGAIESLAKSLATELAPREITVNCVAPGAVETEMIRSHSAERRSAMVTSTPLRRMADPSEIAEAVAYLASDKAGFITGSTLHINGGTRMD